VHKFRTAIYPEFKFFHKNKLVFLRYLKKVALTSNADTASDLLMALSEICFSVTPLSFIQMHDINTRVIVYWRQRYCNIYNRDFLTENHWVFQVSILYFRSDLEL
jgi:hypothetical protein